MLFKIKMLSERPVLKVNLMISCIVLSLNDHYGNIYIFFWKFCTAWLK
jgi:hypothetical protein